MISKLYDDTIEVEFTGGLTHRYKIAGKVIPGVSSVLNVLHKDLMGWAAWMTAEAFREAVTPFATTDQKMTKAALKTMADEAKKAYTHKSQRGKDVGTITHAWIEEETNAGKVIELPEYVKNLVDAVATDGSSDGLELAAIMDNYRAAQHCIAQWRQWVIDYDVEIIKSEFIVYSRILNYCGTCDLLYRSRKTGKLYMGDYKTSEPQKNRNKFYQVTGYRPYPEHFVQITAYDFAHYEELKINPDGYSVIYLPKEGNYQVFNRENVQHDRDHWAHLFKTYQWLAGIRRAK